MVAGYTQSRLSDEIIPLLFEWASLWKHVARHPPDRYGPDKYA